MQLKIQKIVACSSSTKFQIFCFHFDLLLGPKKIGVAADGPKTIIIRKGTFVFQWPGADFKMFLNILWVINIFDNQVHFG